jgi:hypothetical protein
MGRRPRLKPGSEVIRRRPLPFVDPRVSRLTQFVKCLIFRQS